VQCLRHELQGQWDALVAPMVRADLKMQKEEIALSARPQGQAQLALAAQLSGESVAVS